MIYVFDTNSLLVLQNYPPTSFGSFWKKLDALVVGREILSVREVQKELGSLVRKPWLAAWLKLNSKIFLPPTAAEGVLVAEIFKVKHFQGLVGKQQMLTGLHVADPFVIASAQARKGCVVTEEARRLNACKIPNVCDNFKVDCISFEDFIGRQGWSF